MNSEAANSVADVLIRQSDLPEGGLSLRPRIAVVLHLFYEDQLGLFLEYLSHIPVGFDCFVSVKSSEIREVSVAFEALSHLCRLEVKSFPNVGRDMAPCFVGFGKELLHYELVLKLHGKKSPHNSELQDWLSLTLQGLLGAPWIIRHHWALLLGSNIGITSILPPQPVLQAIERDSCWGHQFRSFDRCTRERERLGLSDLQPDEPFKFPVGSMFWCRAEVLRPLVDLNLRWSSFDREAGQLDGTLAHSLERLVGLVCSHTLGLECRSIWPLED